MPARFPVAHIVNQAFTIHLSTKSQSPSPSKKTTLIKIITSLFLSAAAQVWKIGDDVAGYVRTVDKFVQAIVRGAGHILPYDQPERALNLIQNFVNMQ